MDYLKCHLKTKFVNQELLEEVPPSLQVKSNAEQKGILFINLKKGTCKTHYDRDTAILLLLSGTKEVFLAPPNAMQIQNEKTSINSTILDNMNPFSNKKKKKEERRGWKWLEKIGMSPGDALLIPKDWIHTIRSSNETIAISLQVEASTHLIRQYNK